jgi:hypothetical protein
MTEKGQKNGSKSKSNSTSLPNGQQGMLLGSSSLAPLNPTKSAASRSRHSGSLLETRLFLAVKVVMGRAADHMDHAKPGSTKALSPLNGHRKCKQSTASPTERVSDILAERPMKFYAKKADTGPQKKKTHPSRLSLSDKKPPATAASAGSEPATKSSDDAAERRLTRAAFEDYSADEGYDELNAEIDDDPRGGEMKSSGVWISFGDRRRRGILPGNNY